MSQSSPSTQPALTQRSGIIFAFAAYGFWGFMPIYFLALEPTGPFEIVVWRVLFSLVFCGLIILVMRKWSAVRTVLRDRRLRHTAGQHRDTPLPRHNGAGAREHRPTPQHHRGQGEHHKPAQEIAVKTY